MNKKKLKKFVNEHKTKLVVAGSVVLTITLCAMGLKRKLVRHDKITVLLDLADNVNIPAEFAVGKITELWREGEWLNAIVNEVTTADLGRLGEEFVKCGIVPNDTKVTMLIGFI